MDSLEASFKVLNIKSTSSVDQVKKAYRELALKYHPDKYGPEGTAKFQKIQRAYELALTRASTQTKPDIPVRNTSSTRRRATQPPPPPPPQPPFVRVFGRPEVHWVPSERVRSPPPPESMWYDRPTSSNFPLIIETLRQWFTTQQSLIPEQYKNEIHNLPVARRMNENLKRLAHLMENSKQDKLAIYIGKELVIFKHYWIMRSKICKLPDEKLRASTARFIYMAAQTGILASMVKVDKEKANKAFDEFERPYEDPKGL